ncbi:MAG: hypothetical protein ACI9OJ_001672 [Myxococcota bacterium]|jgi:hypothetical protein
MAVLKIMNGPRAGATFRLGERMLTIGRATTNLIQVIDDRVSRRHAMIRWTGSAYLIVDLRSANGLRVNGDIADEATLSPGDNVKIGDTELRVVADNHGAGDGVLDRKEIDPQLVARATVVSNTMASVDELLAAGSTVPVDDIHQMRDIMLHKFLLEVSLASGKDPKTAFKRAIAGIADFIMPDRCLLLGFEGNKARTIGRYVAEDLDEQFRGIPPFLQALRPAMGERRSLIINDLATRAEVDTPIGSVAVTPIVVGERLVGMVYADSFGKECQPFIEEDLEIFQGVAKSLRPAFKLP